MMKFEDQAILRATQSIFNTMNEKVSRWVVHGAVRGEHEIPSALPPTMDKEDALFLRTLAVKISINKLSSEMVNNVWENLYWYKYERHLEALGDLEFLPFDEVATAEQLSRAQEVDHLPDAMQHLAETIETSKAWDKAEAIAYEQKFIEQGGMDAGIKAGDYREEKIKRLARSWIG